jgi:TolB-like protein
MLKFKKLFVFAAVILPLVCLAAYGQVGTAPSSRSTPPPPPPPPPPSGGNAIAAYVYGAENSANAEELAEAVVTNLANSRRYSQPRRGGREFFREADKAQQRSRGRLLEDRDFCRIGSDFGVQFLTVIDIERAGRGNSVWARIIDLSNCRVVATAEYTGLIRNSAEIRSAATALSAELLNTRIGRRSIQVGGGTVAPPPRGNQIAAYVFGIEEARLGEELANSIVTGLVNSRTYSAPRRGAREFFREADKAQARSRGRLLEDRDFCRIGTDYEIEYLTVIDIERAGRGNSVWARILDLETCKVIATGESTALIRNDAEVKAVSDEIVRELLRRNMGRRSTHR